MSALMAHLSIFVHWIIQGLAQDITYDLIHWYVSKVVSIVGNGPIINIELELNIQSDHTIIYSWL